MLDKLHKAKHFRRHRESSYDRTGANRDRVEIGAGETHSLPTLQGPGIIRHLWFTIAPGSVETYKNLILSMTFDGVDNPQVHIPFADMFMFGHGLLVDVNNAAIQVSKQPHISEPPFRGALNCMFPMPFEKSASIRLINNDTAPALVFYYVDWEAHESLEHPILHFHATLSSEETSPPKGQPLQTHGSFDRDIVNRDWAENYCLLDVKDYFGHYVGTSLCVECEPGNPGKWWEGDDMFVIDEEPWPPRLHGTGTEDYFDLAWGFRKVDCRPEYGVTYLEKRENDTDQIDGRFSLYRLHINDPIPFQCSLMATIEHGHANDCNAWYRSVAYWYGRRLNT